MARVAVIGGGVSGLAAAYRLRQLVGPDLDITVIELADRAGGKLRTVELAGQPYDVGAEAFLVRRPEAGKLITELGLGAELTHPTPASATIRAGGRTRPIPTGTVLGVPVSAEAVAGVLSAEGTRRVAAEAELPPVRLAGADVSVGELLRDRLGPEVPDRLVDPLLGGVYAGHADSLGLRATMPALAAKLDAGAGSLVAAAAGLVPPPAPGGVRAPVFGTLRGGLGTLPTALADASGATLRFGRPVRELHRTATGWRLVIGPVPAPEFLDVDAVLLAVPAPAASRLLAEVAPAASAAFARIELASMAVVALALPAAAPLPDNSGVLIGSTERHDDGVPFTAKGFTFSSRKWAHLGGTDHLLVRGSVGRAGEVRTLQRDDADLVAAVRADLAELTGVTAAPVDTLVTRWGGGLPQYGVGHLDLVAEIETAVAKVPGLAVAGAALNGVGLPACVAGADAAASQLAAALRATNRPAGFGRFAG
ncbi:MAG TPA: protoporphyrinogen oxidase [Pseudonocardiaceae bacterium]|jgi:oxygen-dependent protoporphyrinogen oxidase|nr:protoporphyrinogen oxidase [Pseudonocardiaceae bacterium]